MNIVPKRKKNFYLLFYIVNNTSLHVYLFGLSEAILFLYFTVVTMYNVMHGLQHI